MNKTNYNFYKAIPIGTLKKFSESAGLDNAFELRNPKLEDLIKDSKSIMEFGAGEGRILKYLKQINYSGKIYALERSPVFLNNLQEIYGNDKQISILNKDILKDDFPKVELGLFLWAGILEFSEIEQKKLINKLSKYCNTLILDTPLLGAKNNATNIKSKQDSTIETDFGKIKGRIPLEKEIIKWSKGFWENFEKIPYKTSNKRERVLYILSNN